MKGLSMLAATIVAQAALAGAAYKAPRAVHGKPDLQGVWNYSSDVPLERPKEYADRTLVTREERAKQNAAREATFDRLLNTGVGAHDKFWLDYEAHVEDLRTSLITYEASALADQAAAIAAFARAEGLDAHARAVEVRLEP